MFSLNDATIRGSFVNASRKELADLTLPAGFDAIDFARLDYLGWSEPKRPRRAYIVVPVGDEPVGVMLQQADARPTSRAQCTWCQDVQLPNDVVFFSARRAGAAGRKGDTVGTLVCSEFECSRNVRTKPAMAYIGFDVEAARLARIASLQSRVASFAADLRAGV
ncbi:FBP domain-containing protein [Agreia sp. COWG]|uniref:FBP domain-containing protein n=1 Tax=Agreia sp. COWG TaxID=2773266 RepID=UPI00192561D3|nr:FBP domain-containing protein [Agreia sp. COWG]CAD6009126.1 Translation elongation factor [Agreia sp. COWG]